MRAHLRYLSYVVRHKWFVLRAGLKTGAPLWRLLIHDWSKFLPVEWGPYVASFYGGYKYSERPPAVVAAFDRAWLHHQHRNPHHWQHWLLRDDNPKARYVIQSPDGGMTSNTVCRAGGAFTDADALPVDAVDITAPHGDVRNRLLDELVRHANSAPRALPMPEPFVREMVADWMGAGRAITGRWEVREWYAKNAGVMVLHPETRALVEELLSGVAPQAARAAVVA